MRRRNPQIPEYEILNGFQVLPAHLAGHLHWDLSSELGNGNSEKVPGGN